MLFALRSGVPLPQSSKYLFVRAAQVDKLMNYQVLILFRRFLAVCCLLCVGQICKCALWFVSIQFKPETRNVVCGCSTCNTCYTKQIVPQVFANRADQQQTARCGEPFNPSLQSNQATQPWRSERLGFLVKQAFQEAAPCKQAL